MSFSTYLITPAELSAALRQETSSSPTSTIIPLCASWFLPNDAQKRTGPSIFRASRIPNARFFDLDAVKDPESPYPHMLPSASAFASAMGSLGIGNTDTVVVYDTAELGIFSAPRVGWMLKAFRHERVHVLNNYKLWVEQGYPTEDGEPAQPEPVEYKVPAVEGTPSEAVDFEFVKALVTGEGKGDFADAAVLDARPAGRFHGTDPEPRPGLPPGHMPRSTSVPFVDVLDPTTKALLPAERLREVFAAKGVDLGRPVVSSCGTGVTAAVVDAALAEAGVPLEKRVLYDGSWTEWAQRAKGDEGLILKTE